MSGAARPQRGLGLQAQFPDLVRFEQRDHGCDAGLSPSRDLVAKPLTTSRTRHERHAVGIDAPAPENGRLEHLGSDFRLMGKADTGGAREECIEFIATVSLAVAAGAGGLV